MKNTLKFFPTLVIGCLLLLYSCKKESTVASSDSVQSLATSEDNSNFTTATDQAFDDANTTMSGTNTFSGGRIAGGPDLCNASVSCDTTGGNRTATITYHGLNCLGTAIRSGQVILSLPIGVYWGHEGAVLTVTFSNFKVTNTFDNKSITMNGTGTITNVTGGLIVDLSSLQNIIYSADFPGITLTFEDGSNGSSMIARQRHYTYDNGIVITTTGTHTDDAGNTDVEVWGTTRFGNNFSVRTVQPMIVRQDCDFRLTAGQLLTTRMIVPTTITFGLDSKGDPTSCPGLGNYYYSVQWTDPHGVTHISIHPY